MPDPSLRLLSLLSLLQTPRLWSGSELSDRLQVSGRTIRRDIERLRELGYPVHAEHGGKGGYRLAAGAEMPPLMLDDEEAIAVAIGLRAAAAQTIVGGEEAAIRALAKLRQVLPSRLRRRVDSLAAATVQHPVIAAVADPVDPEMLIVAASAIARNERLRFKYTRPGAQAQPRHVEPRALLMAGRRWQLLAFDIDRKDWRTFRLDRAHNPFITGAPARTREVPGGDVATFVAKRTLKMAPTYQADVVVHAQVEEAARRLDTPQSTLTDLGDGTCAWRSPPDTLDWLAFRLASSGLDFETRHPQELADHLQAIARRFRATSANARNH